MVWKIILFSSIIAKVGYTRNTLRIVFHSGSIYDYKDVPYALYKSLVRSDSVGGYYNQFIKNLFTSMKVKHIDDYPFNPETCIDGSSYDPTTDEDFFKALRDNSEKKAQNYLVRETVNDKGINRYNYSVINSNDLLDIINKAHRNNSVIMIFELGKVILDWS